MSFWSGETLLKRGATLFTPFERSQIDCNAYVLRMGNQYYRTANQERDGDEGQTRELLSANEAFVIPAGQFAFLLSKETVSVPASAMAFISMRTAIKFQGLINVSGFHVDPGYSGQLVYAVYNASPSPIHLAEGDLAFKIWFCDIDKMSEAPYIKRAEDGLHEINGDMVRGMNREILSLQSLAEKLRSQDQLIETRFAEQRPVLDNLAFVWRYLQLGVILAALLAFLSFALPVSTRGGELLRDWIWPHGYNGEAPVAPSAAETNTNKNQ